ncbi:MAG: hypothetical protein ABI589_03045 [Burkholderiales bacterium]
MPKMLRSPLSTRNENAKSCAKLAVFVKVFRYVTLVCAVLCPSAEPRAPKTLLEPVPP